MCGQGSERKARLPDLQSARPYSHSIVPGGFEVTS
jgi:hypothetical protein